MNRFSLDELLLGKGHDDQTGRRREETALTSYLVNQVVLGRSELIEGRTRAYVSSATMDAFEEMVLREGGVSFAYHPSTHPEHPSTVMRLNRFLVRYKREAGGPSGVLTDRWGPWGIPRTTAYENENQ